MEERLQKILARAGYGSRRQCEELIQYGRVRVNGKTAVLGFKANAAEDAIMVDDKKIKLEEFNFRYIALNKPRNVLSDCDSFGERKTVHDLIGTTEHMFAVGRLDFDSEGLILMTNDGDLANKLTHPRYGHEKEYHVKVVRAPDEKQLAIWRRGVVLADGYKTAPAIVQVMKSDSTYALLRIILKEGRKRQIREIGALIGVPVSRILRVRIGTLLLGTLKPGAWRDLTPKEVYNLKATAGALRTDKKPHSKTRMMNGKRDWSAERRASSEEQAETSSWKRRDGEPSENADYTEIKPRRPRASVESLYRPAGAEGKTNRSRGGTDSRTRPAGSSGPDRRSRYNSGAGASTPERDERAPRRSAEGSPRPDSTDSRVRRTRSDGDLKSRSSSGDSQERQPRRSGEGASRPASASSKTGRSRSSQTGSRSNSGGAEERRVRPDGETSYRSEGGESSTRRPRSGEDKRTRTGAPDSQERTPRRSSGSTTRSNSSSTDRRGPRTGGAGGSRPSAPNRKTSGTRGAGPARKPR